MSLGAHTGALWESMSRNQLLGFIEQMGHEYQDLLMGATEEGGENISKPDLTALAAATDRVLNSLMEGGDGGKDNSDDEEEEGGQSKGSKSDEEEGNCGRK